MRLRPLVFALIAASMLAFAPSARAVPPTIVSPADGAEVPAGFTGPVQVTWQEAGEMKIEVSGPQPTETLATTVAPEDVGSTLEYTISALSAPGAYTIAAGRRRSFTFNSTCRRPSPSG